LKYVLNVSVRELVEHTLRSGDLNLTFFSMDRPVQAIRAHQSIQDSRPEEYTAEVVIQHHIDTKKYQLNINGRIDGVYNYRERVVIDEIKTTRKSLAVVQENEDAVHWGQAKCYAYIYATQNNLEKIDVQLTYVQLDKEETAELRRTFDLIELRSFFDALITQYLEWANMITAWVELRDRSIAAMGFPFDAYRPGQESMMEETARAIEERTTLLIQAPTGIGKTMAVIVPAVRAIAKNLVSKVFYLTARTTGRNAAEHSLEILRGNGLRLKYLSLTAKDKLCFDTNKSCNGEDCVYARGFYDRINEALREAFGKDSFTRQAVLDIAQKHKICPFEFSLELSLWVDFIICDYNYVFDPRVYLRRFFENGNSSHLLLVDEAHNLVDRSREMYSAVVYKNPLLTLRRRLRKRCPRIYRSLGLVNSWLARAEKDIPEGEKGIAQEEYPVGFCQHLRKFASTAEQWLVSNEQSVFRRDLLDAYFLARRFLNTAERYDETYATCYNEDNGNFSVKLFCIDPSKHLRQIITHCATAVYFSATLTPMQYFAELFGCDENARHLSLPSPFPSEHLCVFIAGKISALYKYREFTKHEVARMISALIDQKKGNYFIYFPSYEYMKMIHGIFEQRRPRAKIIVQKQSMSEQDREYYLAHFDQSTDDYLTGFAVMGGFFAESIDLVGERLTGAAIVGVGFPQISLEREIIRAYFDNVNGSGFAFAYQVPGMIKVLQAAGRVIRSETDKGVVLLIDTRYTRPPYRAMLPKEWRPVFVDNIEKLSSLLQDFWEQ